MKEISQRLIDDIRFRQRWAGINSKEIIQILFDEGFNTEEVIEAMRRLQYPTDVTKMLLQAFFDIDLTGGSSL